VDNNKIIDDLIEENGVLEAEIERLRECLQHAIDHVGKWQLFTAEEKQRILAEYEQAVRGER
jgi:regulator of replication initiation timing